MKSRNAFRRVIFILVAVVVSVGYFSMGLSQRMEKKNPRKPVLASMENVFMLNGIARQRSMERRKKDFAPSRELLKKKGVPFDPDELLDPARTLHGLRPDRMTPG